MIEERRGHQRHPIELAASYGVSEDKNFAISTQISNISGGGFCVSSKEKIDEGREIQLSVKLNEHEYVIIQVRVAWWKHIEESGEYSVGVQIIDSSGPDFERFFNFYVEEINKIQE